MSTELRLGLVAFCCDFGLYVIMSALPYRLLEFGANSSMLGAAPACYAAPYALLVLLAGRRSDRQSRTRSIRWGALIAAGGALALSGGTGPIAVLASIPILAVGLSSVWPSVQAGFSEIHEGRRLARQTGFYNLSWSCGKGLGFLVGGALIARIGAQQSFLVAAAAYGLAALALPSLRRAGEHTLESVAGRESIPARERLAFLRSAWLLNGVAFGVGAVVNHHLPRILEARGDDAVRFGQLLGTIFLSQTLSFPLLARWHGWHYRLRAVLVVQLLLIALAVGIVRLPATWLLFAGAALLGAGLGFCYQSSLYYSLHSPTGRGRQAGIHEASLGVASALLPLAGGMFATLSGDLRAPFLLASLALALCLPVVTWQVHRARSQT